MVSGLAPGKLALTEMVGNSTSGSGDTGSNCVGRGSGQCNRDQQQGGGDGLTDKMARKYSSQVCQRLRPIAYRPVELCNGPL